MLDDPEYVSKNIVWECGDCQSLMKTYGRGTHASRIHKKEIHEIVWMALDAVQVKVCNKCLVPTYAGTRNAMHRCTKKLKREFLAMEKEKAEGAYWIDWSEEIPAIKIFDEQAPEGTQWLTLLEARDQILYVARTQIVRWYEAAYLARKITQGEIEEL